METLVKREAGITAEDKYARRAAYVSLVIAVALLALKLYGYWLTGSQAVFSDAMETIVNVVAALVAIIVLSVAHKPADKDHPYGHGKLEFFSAAFEGALITFAAVFICFEAVRALIEGPRIERVGLGLAVTIIAGLINAALGLYLIKAGKRHNSETLRASGLHVLSDFWTSAGVVVGLILVSTTGSTIFDPIAALIVGTFLARTGIKIVVRSGSALMDAEDVTTLESFLEAVERERPPGIIQVHHVRIMRSGRYHHVDAHAVVPEYWTVDEAHSRTKDFEDRVIHAYPHPGELHLQVDPCRRAYCRGCEVLECPIRQQPFEARLKLSIEDFTDPNEPPQYTTNSGGRDANVKRRGID